MDEILDSEVERLIIEAVRRRQKPPGVYPSDIIYELRDSVLEEQVKRVLLALIHTGELVLKDDLALEVTASAVVASTKT